MTYIPLGCSNCARILAVYPDERYPNGPPVVFCDGDCWRGTKTPNPIKAEARASALERRNGELEAALRAVVDDWDERSNLSIHPGEDGYALRARLEQTCRCGDGCSRNRHTEGCNGPYTEDYQQEQDELRQRVREALLRAGGEGGK